MCTLRFPQNMQHQLMQVFILHSTIYNTTLYIKMDSMDTIDLGNILKKCKKEDQPLYIDEGMESIACSWCPGFKGSIEVQVINQHTTRSRSHI